MGLSAFLSPVAVYSLATVLPGIAIIVVSLRFYTRVKRWKTHLAFDDYVQPPILAFFIGMCICMLIGVSNKAYAYPTIMPPGADRSTFNSPSLTLGKKLGWALVVFMALALGLTKLAALWFYRRMFCVQKKGALNYTIVFLLALTAVWSLFSFLATVLKCGPHISAAWDGPQYYRKYCRPFYTPFQRFYSISDVVLDSIIILLPLPSIWQLHSTIKTKLSLTFVFLLALIGYAGAVGRMLVVIGLTKEVMSTSGVLDVQLGNTRYDLFGLVEVGLGLIAINLPSLWGLVKELHPGTLLSSFYSSLVSRGSSSNSQAQSNLDMTARSRSRSYGDLMQAGESARCFARQPSKDSWPSISLPLHGDGSLGIVKTTEYSVQTSSEKSMF